MKQYNNKRPSIPANIKRAVEVEAGHACSIKECKDHTYLEIHHINENREDNNIENLILLCTKHHKMAHKKAIDRKALREYKLLLQKDKILVDSYSADEDENYGLVDYFEIINKRNEEILFIISNFMKRHNIYNDLIYKTSDKIFELNNNMENEKFTNKQSIVKKKKILKLLSNDTLKYSEFINSQLKIFSESRKDLFHAILKSVELSTNEHQMSPEVALNVFKNPLVEFKDNIINSMIKDIDTFLSKLKELPNMFKEFTKSSFIAIKSLEQFVFELKEFSKSIDKL